MLHRDKGVTAYFGGEAEPDAQVSFQPLVRSLQSILTEIDEQYERERDQLIESLPNTEVRERALAMLKSRHLERRENYARELAAILEGIEQ